MFLRAEWNAVYLSPYLTIPIWHDDLIILRYITYPIQHWIFLRNYWRVVSCQDLSLYTPLTAGYSCALTHTWRNARQHLLHGTFTLLVLSHVRFPRTFLYYIYLLFHEIHIQYYILLTRVHILLTHQYKNRPSTGTLPSHKEWWSSGSSPGSSKRTSSSPSTCRRGPGQIKGGAKGHNIEAGLQPARIPSMAEQVQDCYELSDPQSVTQPS